MSKRGRKKGSGYRITRAELFAYWEQFVICQGLARLNAQELQRRQRGMKPTVHVSKERIATPRSIFTKVAYAGMDLLLAKAENLPEVRKLREQRESKRTSSNKELSFRLGVTRQALHARKKRRLAADARPSTTAGSRRRKQERQIPAGN